MANIVLPQVAILQDIDSKTNIMIEWENNIYRIPADTFVASSLPAFDAINDEGKILSIVDGMASWVRIDNARSAEF